MKILKFAGAFLYGALMAYLMWLLFYWITPIAMLMGWGWFIVYLFVAGGFISMLVGSISYLLVIPIVRLSQGRFTTVLQIVLRQLMTDCKSTSINQNRAA